MKWTQGRKQLSEFLVAEKQNKLSTYLSDDLPTRSCRSTNMLVFIYPVALKTYPINGCRNISKSVTTGLVSGTLTAIFNSDRKVGAGYNPFLLEDERLPECRIHGRV